MIQFKKQRNTTRALYCSKESISEVNRYKKNEAAVIYFPRKSQFENLRDTIRKSLICISRKNEFDKPTDTTRTRLTYISSKNQIEKPKNARTTRLIYSHRQDEFEKPRNTTRTRQVYISPRINLKSKEIQQERS